MAAPTLLTPELIGAFEGVVPLVVSTCDAEAKPNVTFMSQIFYVDEQHVALSHQFMNKTWRNLQINPVFLAFVTSPETLSMWKLKLQFIEMQKEGSVFEEMEMQLMALSTPEHITFSLHAAIICKVLEVETVFSVSKS